MSQALFDCAERFSASLLQLAVTNDRICIVINDSAETHHATAFQMRFPERIIDVGIAEQNMVGVAAGLANAGRIAFVHSASCFLTARAMEQIKADVAYSNNNVKLCGFVSGVAYGALGGTHHSLEDLAWMRAIPNLRVAAPASPNDTAAVVRAAVAVEGPVFIRVISKTGVPEIFPADHAFEFGRGHRLRRGADVGLIGTGVMTSRLLDVAERLEELGISASVFHMGSISPIDEALIAEAARSTGRLVVAEEHYVTGGLGGAVAEVVVRHAPVPMLLLGAPHAFAPIGPAGFLFDHFGLTPEKLTVGISAWLAQTAPVRQAG